MSKVYLESSAVGYRGRVHRLAVITLAAFTLLGIRLAHLQLLEGDNLSRASTKNFVRSVRLPSDRGTVYDRHGRVLAINRPSFDLYVTPAKVEKIERLLNGLREVLELDELDIVRLRERIEEPRGMWRHQPIRVARDIDRQRVAQAETLRARADGISIRVRYRREYPEGEIGAHLVGYLGRPNRAELDRDREGRYHVHSSIGRFGLERRFESVLGGRDGVERYVVNARGARKDEGWADRAIEGDARRREPDRGHDIVLTADAEVQRLLVHALRRYDSGSAVVMDVQDGSILGVVSKPSFDPNEWSGGLSRETKRAIDDNPYNPMLDKSVHSYFPGSVYKVVTALAALEEGALDPEEPIESPGRYEYGNRTFHCHKRSGHGAVDLNDAMAASADVYFYKLGEELGIDTLAVYARRFGFGQAAGLGINGESKGIVPTREYHQRATEGGFQHGLALSSAIGQGDVRTTPIQIASAFSTLANGGSVYAPRVVQRIVAEDGRVVSEFEPKVRAELDADPDHIARINRSLERAVNDPERATGHLAAIPYGNVAGKTGTAQVRKIIRGQMRQTVKRFRDRDHAWFAAFAPYESPRIAVVVFLEHGGSGGKDAAPVAREIIEAYHERVEPIFSTTASAGREATGKRR